jgi:hypothetical protein
MRGMQMLPIMASRLGVVVMLLASAAAVPQQAGNRYTIEIVVFRNSGQAGALSDNTPAQLTGDDVEQTAVATRKLTSAASRLRNASGYRVLAHTAWAQAPTAFNSRRGVSAVRLGLGAGITGKVILERGQYLHMGIDLTIDDGGRRYHISEVRRIKPDEAQYFDHPAVGVLALVTAGG